MVKTINMLELRSKIGEVLDQTYYKKDYFLIRRGRKDLAVIIPLEDYQLIKDLPKYTEEELDQMGWDMVKADRITRSLAKKLKITYQKKDKRFEKTLQNDFKFFLRNRYGSR